MNGDHNYRHGTTREVLRVRAPKLTKTTLDSRALWRILIPLASNKGFVFSSDHHERFLNTVRSVSRGLTNNAEASGEWQPKKKLYREPLIPIDFLANDAQADEVAIIAREHYQQIEVHYYVISKHVRKATLVSRKRSKAIR
jgi:NADH dehydrogenase/NADH:ubiquinone oxidoreductase subunit G